MYSGLLLVCIAFAGCMEGVLKEAFLTEKQCDDRAQIVVADISRAILEQGMMVRVQYKCVQVGQSAASVTATNPNPPEGAQFH